MGSCTSKAPKRKKHECRPTKRLSNQEFTELPATNREDEAAAENGFPALSPSKSQTPTKSMSNTQQPHLADPGTQFIGKTLMPVTNNSGLCAGYVCIHGDLLMNNTGKVDTKADCNEDFTIRFTQLQERLKRHFNAITMKGLPWMKDINLTLRKYYVTLKMTTSDSIGRNLPPQRTTIEQTFVASEGQDEPFRILVEGGPGFGKTTLAAKLAYDWAQNEAYIRHFDVVLYIPLRHFTKGWRETLKLAARLHEADDCEMLLKIMERNTKRFLLIFDGYDELSENNKEKINAIIQREVLADITVVVTSRIGKFTSNMEEESREWFMKPADIAFDINQNFDKKIVIAGVDDSMKREFIKTYSAGFSNKVQHSTLQNIDQMQINNVLAAELLKCPVFLLMIILLLIDDCNADVQNLKTRTELYKSVFNFVLRRYYSKGGESTTPDVELFSNTRDTTSACFRIMIQFSHFALYGIQQNTLSFSREEILDNCVDVRAAASPDSTQLIPLNLGFLTECVLEEGFRQKTVYEPIHKSLLEFAAAFCIWSAFLDGRQDLWQSQVHSLRPRNEVPLNFLTSLVFPFLAGLMGKDAWILFDELRPYAAEYSLWFGTLKSSILETRVTPKLLTSLCPLLPITLTVQPSERDNNFSNSRHHEEIIRFGTHHRKIQVIIWDFYLAVSFPLGEVVVDRLILELTDPTCWRLYKFPSNVIQCLHMWCCFEQLLPCTSDETWDNTISLVQKIQSSRISFATYCGSYAISRILAAVTSGVLQHVNVNCIRYVVEHNRSYLEEVSNLIRADQVEVIELILYEPEDTYPDRTVHTPLIEKENLGKCCKSVTQEQIDYLIKCASESTKLVRFVIENDPNNPFTVDMSLLCDRGYKSWRTVCLKGVTIQCKLEVKKRFQINHLEITDVHFNTVLDFTNNLLYYCHVSSFAYKHKTVLGMNDFPTLNNFPAELLLQLADVIPQGFPLSSIHTCNLQILTLDMTSVVSQASQLTSMVKLFPFTNNTLHIRGLELLGLEHNHTFATLFINYICELCRLSREGYSSEKNLHRLQYVMLHTETHPKRLCLLSVKKSIVQFLSCISKLKSALKDQLLLRLDVLCYPEVFSYIWNVEREGVCSLCSLFPDSEGFRFEHDFYGMRDNDSIRSKELYERTPYPQERVSIQLNKCESNSS